jgi:glutaredoxin
VKEFLSRAGVPFVDRNVEEDASAYDELIKRGWRTVPLTVVGNREVKGYDVPTLEAALRAAAEPPPDR